MENGPRTHLGNGDADVALMQAKTNYTQALVDFEVAEARLQKSTGE